MKLLRRFSEQWADVSLRTKITGVTVFILFLGLIVAGVGTFTVLRPMYISEQTSRLMQLRANPAEQLAQGADTRSLTDADILGANGRYYVALLDPTGEVRFDNSRWQQSNDLPIIPAHLNLEYIEQVSPDIVEMGSHGSTHWRGVVIPTFTNGAQNGSPSGILLIAESTTVINQNVAMSIIVFTGFGCAVILLGAALTRVLITTTLLPLAEVERTALEISRGDFSKRIMVASPHTEVGHLGESLNVMLDRLDGSIEDRERTIERMRRFVGDAGHELRTPLVSVRGYAELYRMGGLESEEAITQAMGRIESEAIRMTSLVEDLLALARLDERRPLALASLPMNQLAHDAALDARAGAPDREVTVHEDPSEPWVLGDEHKVRQLLTNLVGNAIQHTPDGSPIEISVSTLPVPPDSTAPPVTRFEIIDHGEGVPAQVRDKIFGRFWRADSSRNRETGGSGLGLAIVKSIVDAHRGAVSVHETPGGGATFRVDLPGAFPPEILPEAESARI